MPQVIGQRIARLVGVLFVVSLGSFFLLSLIPGDPVVAVLGRNATPAQYASVRHQLGLDRPITTRYFHWLGGILSGNPGQTIVPPVRNVSTVISAALPVTLEISIIALIIGLLVGLPLGIWAAYRAGGVVDRALGILNFGLISVPVFVMGVLVILLLVFHPGVVATGALVLGIAGAAVTLLGAVVGKDSVHGFTRRRIATACVSVVVGALIWQLTPTFPRQGWVPLSQDLGQNLKFAFLPSLTLALGLIPLYAMLLRSDMEHTLKQDFITVARAKGMSTTHIILREALRPSLFSLVTVAGLSFGALLGGSVIVETLFNLPGLGKLMVSSIQSKDFLVVQVCVLIIATAFVLLNALVDLSYSILEPRVRRAHA